MKKSIAIAFVAWMSWVDTTRWDQVAYLDEDSQSVQVSSSTQNSSPNDQPVTQKESREPRLEDVLLGPPAPSWRDLRQESFK